jgi:hypothetical protein
MKKNEFFSIWLLLSLCTVAVFFSSFDKSATPESVLINGVRWATCNVDQPGTFAGSPESPGMFYQWNRKKGWPATGSVTGWDNSLPTGDSWEKENDPSPTGYRVPTYDEIKTLLDTDKVSNEWTTVNGVNGRKFTDKKNGNSIFLPAVGYRDGSIGTLFRHGRDGHYWSSTADKSDEDSGLDLDLNMLETVALIFMNDGDCSFQLSFDSDGHDLDYGNRSHGYSVRPVAE